VGRLVSKQAKEDHPWRVPFEDHRLAWITEGERWDAQAKDRWMMFSRELTSLLPEVARIMQQWVHQMQGRYIGLPADCHTGDTDPMASNGYTPAIRTLLDMVDARTAAVLMWDTGKHGSDAEVRACVSRAVRDYVEVIG
jgi:hypothetical protein